MSDGFQPNLDFKAANEAAEDGEALIVDVEGYEGPLHVLLALARSQKVDLMQLSITRLAEQYLAFVQRARALRFSLAADYLVMAAWLAYLKSRLLLPRPDKGRGDEPPAEEVAANLAFRLAKLDAMRKASEALNQRPRLKRDVFTRGDPEQVKVVGSGRLEGDLYQLMSAYILQRRREHYRTYRPEAPVAGGYANCCPNSTAGRPCRGSPPCRSRSSAPAGPAISPRPSRPAWSWSRKGRWRRGRWKPSPTST